MPAKKPAAKKAPAKKAAAKKAPAKKAPAKKAAAKKAPAKKAAAKKAPAKKAAAKKAPAKKAAAKKAPAAAPAPAAKKATKKAAAKKAPPATTDFAAAIARIEAKAAAAGVELAAGASAEAVEAAEKALGFSLPAEVVAFYRQHDGATDDYAIEGRELLSLSRMVDEWKIWKDLLDRGIFEANDHGRPDPGVQKKWWIPEWVPVTYDGAGNHHVLDLAPAEGGTYGQVLSFWHDDDPRTVVAPSFLAWLEAAEWGDPERDGDD